MFAEIVGARISRGAVVIVDLSDEKEIVFRRKGDVAIEMQLVMDAPSAVPVVLTMRRATLVGIPAMPIPAAPLVVRRARIEEAGALAALLGAAFEGEIWDVAGTERELFCDETVRATLVVAAEGRPVATASLQVRSDTPECGWVRWVATEPEWRGKGLARAVVIGVLTLAAQGGCREARLRTSTDRLAAIRLYLQLGFEPL